MRRRATARRWCNRHDALSCRRQHRSASLRGPHPPFGHLLPICDWEKENAASAHGLGTPSRPEQDQTIDFLIVII